MRYPSAAVAGEDREAAAAWDWTEGPELCCGACPGARARHSPKRTGVSPLLSPAQAHSGRRLSLLVSPWRRQTAVDGTGPADAGVEQLAWQGGRGLGFREQLGLARLFFFVRSGLGGEGSSRSRRGWENGFQGNARSLNPSFGPGRIGWMGWDGSNDWGRRKRVQIALDENDDDTALLALAARPGKARRQGKVRAVWKGVQQGQHAFTMESTRDGLAAPPSAPLPKSHPGISKCWRRKPCQPGTRVGQRAGARAQEPSAGLLGSNGGAIAATIWKRTPMGQVRAVRDGGAGGAGGGGVTAPRRTLHVMVRERSVSVAVMPLLRLQKAHGANGSDCADCLPASWCGSSLAASMRRPAPDCPPTQPRSGNARSSDPEIQRPRCGIALGRLAALMNKREERTSPRTSLPISPRGRLKLKKPGGGVQGRGPPERTLGETHTHALVRSLECISGDSVARSKGVAFACARQSFTELGTRAMISVSASPSLQGVLLGGASHCTALERRGNKRAGPAANAPNARRQADEPLTDIDGEAACWCWTGGTCQPTRVTGSPPPAAHPSFRTVIFTKSDGTRNSPPAPPPYLPSPSPWLDPVLPARSLPQRQQLSSHRRLRLKGCSKPVPVAATQRLPNHRRALVQSSCARAVSTRPRAPSSWWQSSHCISSLSAGPSRQAGEQAAPVQPSLGPISTHRHQTRPSRSAPTRSRRMPRRTRWRAHLTSPTSWKYHPGSQIYPAARHLHYAGQPCQGSPACSRHGVPLTRPSPHSTTKTARPACCAPRPPGTDQATTLSPLATLGL
ncbi:hypothetical protein PCL_09902 [Purpureocillium lilacinum]|uniref:Uncharacterized protein n=1 Tax=Purpureocillium lilacinum TaxID=33203 RepID=A0A2U3EEE2_PURLI|nr:hypothetical protein PCL_09902 [Purpureocillium lilacinum]